MQETLNFSQAILENSAHIISVERSLTLSDNLSKPSIRSVFRGKDTLIFNVGKVLVNRFLNAFAFATKLSDAQVTVFTADVLECFKYESLEDMVLFFKMARQGKFGTTKRGVDSNLVTGDWFQQFMELKAKAREDKVTIQQKQFKSDNQISMKAVEITYKKAERQREIEQQRRQKQQFVDDAVKDLDKHGLEDLIMSWERDETMKVYLPLLKRKRRTIK